MAREREEAIRRESEDDEAPARGECALRKWVPCRRTIEELSGAQGVPPEGTERSGSLPGRGKDSCDPLKGPLVPRDNLTAMTRRYRCATCGNLTRFTVTTTVTSRAFHHFTVGGDLTVEDSEVLDERVDEVTCRWCGNGAAVEELRETGV